MIQKCSLAKQWPAKTQLLVCGVFQDQAWNEFLTGMDEAGLKELQDEAQRLDFSGKTDQQLTWYSATNKLLVSLVGLGKVLDLSDDSLINLGAKASRQAKNLKSLLSSLTISKTITPADITDLTVGLHLGLYKFDHYKKQEDYKEVQQKWSILADNSNQNSKALNRGEILAEAIAKARDLVNEPGNILTPVALAEEALKLAKAKGLKAKILNLKDIQKENMNLFLAVASGSTVNPPTFIHLHYKPSKKSSRKVFLVGKGVTFDSGGLSLKPGASMMTMKMDMGGAAAVIAAIGAIAELKADIEVHAIVAATENMPDGASCRPGDIVIGRNGTSVEILNTDAEGRLTLGDALSYAVDQGATEIIDLATLTGACMVALGTQAAALYSDHKELRDGLLSAAQVSKEDLWHMPLSKNLKKSIKSPVADLKNIGGPYGGSITAALFLQHFVGEVPWAHLDIAGPAYSEEEQGYITKGGRGYGVRTLVEYICPQK
jgi:leucyl aminopeptidase